MCFRPAASEMVPLCPNCAKEVPVVGGAILKKCPHCKADMPVTAPEPGAPDALGASDTSDSPKSSGK